MTVLAPEVVLVPHAVGCAVTHMSLATATPHCHLVSLHTAADLLWSAIWQDDVVVLAHAAHMRV